MNRNDERLYPDSDSDSEIDVDNIDENINQVNQVNQVNQDNDLEQALNASLQDYDESQKRIYDAYNNIIATTDEYLKSLILENLSSSETEYVLSMLEKYYANIENRLLIEQQQRDYEESLIKDQTPEETPEVTPEETPEETPEVTPEVKKVNLEELRLERLKFFYKK